MGILISAHKLGCVRHVTFDIILSTCQKLSVRQFRISSIPGLSKKKKKKKMRGRGGTYRVQSMVGGAVRRVQYLVPVCPHLTTLAGVPEKALFPSSLQVLDAR